MPDHSSEGKLMTYTDDALAAYVECALWSSTDDSTPEGGEPMDRNYGPDDIAPEALAAMRADVEAFERKATEILDTFEDVDISAESFGHDFWLTRNRHGAGFWDRELGEAGDQLTAAAQAYGESYLYVGDDGRVYVV
jgi:hypothetical protein